MREIPTGIICLLILVSCTVRSSGTSVPETFEAKTIAGLVAAQYCAAFRRCLPDVRPEHVLHENVCQAQLTRQFFEQLEPLESAIEARRIIYQQERLRLCLDSMASSDCRRVDLQGFEADCAGIVQGQSPIGSPCEFDAECAFGFCPGEDGCVSVCTALSEVGGACDVGRDLQCRAGLDCDREETCQLKEEIQLRGGLGQLCHVHPCESGLRCVRLPEPTCLPFGVVYARREGQACRGPTESRPELGCGPGLVCSFPEASSVSGEGVCRAMPEEGEACYLTIGGSNAWCAPGLYCQGLDPVGGVQEGNCQPMPETGEVCGDFFGSPRLCAPGDRCVEQVCAPKNNAGESCLSDRECSQGRCRAGTCAFDCVAPNP